VKRPEIIGIFATELLNDARKRLNLFDDSRRAQTRYPAATALAINEWSRL
jgi:hypothetical protein